MTPNEINVHIGKVKVGKNQDVLTTILGSCIGIGFIWPQRELYGLAHCLLPKSPNKLLSLGGRYVDQAVFSLIALMHIKKDEYHNLQAIVAGGGNMTHPGSKDTEKLVGTSNSKMALQCLEDRKIKIVHKDIGGEEGRKVTIYCSTGQFEVKKIPRSPAA